MDSGNKKKASLFIIIFFVAFGVITALGLSTFLYLQTEHLEITLVHFFPINIINSIKQDPKHGMFLISISLMVIMGIVYILVSSGDKNNFASEMDVVTPKISTPKRVGQFQHGSAKWLDKSEYIAAFERYILDKRYEGYRRILENGQMDINYIRYLKAEIETQTKAEFKSGTSADTAKSVARAKIIDRERLKDNPILSLPRNQKLLQKTNSRKPPRPIKPKNVNVKGGLVVHFSKKNKNEEYVSCLGDDVHSLILGATRSGKTRCLILESVCLLGITGESMVINDPKGEISDYTKPFLEQLGYEVITLNFREPLFSHRYNFLQPVINAINANDIPTAVELVWDITASLVGESKGERIWHDGEASVITGSIISVVYDNRGVDENGRDMTVYQNFTNVYNFISYMCRSKSDGSMPLSKYTKELPDNHPAKSIFAVAEIAPVKTRGSFFTSALATLRLFTNPNIYNMTNKSDFILEETGDRKRVVYIVLPDEKTTYYSIASLFVYQHYVALVKSADKKGGRLDIRVNFLLDEFGNFARIPAFDNMLTVSGGRGVRFNLIVQSFGQMEEKYGKDITNTLKENCGCLVFLKSTSPETTADISKRLGDYTTSSFSRSESISNKNSSGSNSNSMNLIARPLLKSEEILKIDRPYALVMYGGVDPAMTILPDISKWNFNIALGMGDEEHNILLRMIRKDKRPSRTIGEIALWGVWNDRKYLSKGELNDLLEKEALQASERAYRASGCLHEGGDDEDIYDDYLGDDFEEDTDNYYYEVSPL